MTTSAHDRLTLLEQIIASSDDAIASETLDGVVTSWNPGAQRIFGYTAAEMIGRPIATIVSPDRFREETELLRRLSRGEHVDHYETLHVHKYARPVEVSVVLSPLRDATGTIIGVSAIARDISERKRREARLREQHARVLAAEHTGRADAERASRVKDEFLVTLAHELRNPLAAVLNSVATLDRIGSASREARQARAIIRRQTEHLAGLLDDLLDVARIGQGRTELKLEAVDLRTVALRALEAGRHRFEAKDQRVSVDVCAEPLMVRGDPVRIRQIVANLLDNAFKYTPPAGIITVVLAAENDDAVLRVLDTGLGIPPEKLGEIFELFTRLPAPDARTERGLGVGLALARRLTTLHGGTVTALSEGEGKGSEFVVRLPTLVGAPPHAETEPMVDPAEVSRFRILVIEDDRDSRDALAMSLELEGQVVFVAGTAREGLAIAIAERPAVIIVDIGLPDANGYEVARRLRQALGRDAVLVAFSGYGQPEDRWRSRDAGFDAHIVKPVAPETIVSCCRAELRRHRPPE